jgi:hypothetical protein
MLGRSLKIAALLMLMALAAAAQTIPAGTRLIGEGGFGGKFGTAKAGDRLTPHWLVHSWSMARLARTGSVRKK